MSSYGRAKVLTALFLLCAPLVGCVSQPRAPEETAVVVAKREALEKWGWKNVEVSSALFENGRWVIHLTMLPKTPGGHATVEVSEDGKILDTRGGR
jgi:hypothetical protein